MIFIIEGLLSEEILIFCNLTSIGKLKYQVSTNMLQTKTKKINSLFLINW